MRFLHTADWQWGMPAHFLKSEDARVRYRDARFEAVRRAGETARREGCAFMVVCGDVFDANQLSRDTVLRAVDVLRDITVPVYLLPGNHDPYDPGSIYRSELFKRVPEHVHVLTEPGVHTVSEGVELVAVPWTSKAPVEDLVTAQLRTLAPADPGIVRIVAGHGQVDIKPPDAGLPYLIRSAELRAALDDGRVHYVALGDRHSLTGYAELGDRVRYSGTPEVTDYDEQEPGKVLVVDLGEHGERCETAARRTGAWTFRDLDWDLNDAADVERLDRELSAMPGKRTTAVRLKSRGTLSLAEHARLERVVADHAEVFARIYVWESHSKLAVLPGNGEVSDLGLSGYAAEAFTHLRATADAGGDDAADAQDALRLLYLLAGSDR